MRLKSLAKDGKEACYMARIVLHEDKAGLTRRIRLSLKGNSGVCVRGIMLPSTSLRRSVKTSMSQSS